jgi:hypothetical protein
MVWLEEFMVRRKLKQRLRDELEAREAEAFLILQAEWDAEVESDR